MSKFHAQPGDLLKWHDDNSLMIIISGPFIEYNEACYRLWIFDEAEPERGGTIDIFSAATLAQYTCLINRAKR